MDAFPKYSTIEEQPLRMLYSDITQYHIYVEDRDGEDMYSVILSNIFQKKIPEGNIRPLSGKTSVIQTYSEVGDEAGNIFIVDADFDILLDTKCVLGENFFYLQRYNIESYLINPREMVGWVYATSKFATYRQVATDIDIENWLRMTYDELERLFLAYACVKSINPTAKTVGIGYSKYLTDNLIDHIKISDYIDKVKTKYPAYDETYNDIKRKYIANLDEKKERLICGKYILHLFQRFLTTISYQRKYEAIIKDLCFHINPDNFASLRDEILNYINGV